MVNIYFYVIFFKLIFKKQYRVFFMKNLIKIGIFVFVLMFAVPVSAEEVTFI